MQNIDEMYLSKIKSLEMELEDLKNETVSIKTLLNLLALHGGEIVSTASLTPNDIEQARASGRMHVNEFSLGFVWQPKINRFPETIEEVEQLEKWYPLPVEFPEHLSFEKVMGEPNDKRSVATTDAQREETSLQKEENDTEVWDLRPSQSQKNNGGDEVAEKQEDTNINAPIEPSCVTNLSSADSQMRQEFAIVKKIGDEIGYGNLMEIASALWRKMLRETGSPEIGAFVPTIKDFIKDEYQTMTKNACKLYDKRLKNSCTV